MNPNNPVPCELDEQLESLFDTIWRCERQWRIDDRFDFLLGNPPHQEQR